MRLTMLGTGNALVTEVYNTCFVIENENQYLLVDVGTDGINFTIVGNKAVGMRSLPRWCGIGRET